jgi:hypothetical protein
MSDKIASGLKSLFTIAKNAATGVEQTVTPEIKAERLSICFGCDRLNKTLQQCKECGCFVRAKSNFKQEKCPLGKWGEIE